jgi:putative sterol carrier protein
MRTMQPTRAVHLADLDPQEVEEYFAAEAPERIVTLVDEASDDELARLARIDHLRRVAVREILSRLEEFAIVERLAEVSGAVSFHVDVPRRDAERHHLVLGGGSVRLVDAVAEPGHQPDVLLRLGVVDFLRLVTGGVNAAYLYLGGRLAVDGDAVLALAVGGVFQVPGRPGVAVDPDAIDPAEVARVLKGVKDAHLRSVMAGGFRPVVLHQVFKRFPEFLDAQRAADADLSVGFRIRGRSDGGEDDYVVEVRDGTCQVSAGGRGRDATLALDGAAFLKLVTGHLNPVIGVMRGALKVRGDVGAGLALHKMMRIPGQDG